MEFHLGSSDISSVRFGISPGHDLVHAVRARLRPPAVPLHWAWFRTLPPVTTTPAFRLLASVSGPRGYLPDFLTATPTGDMTPQEELARLRTVPAARLCADLHKMLDRATGARHRQLQAMIDDPERSRERIAEAWEEVWEALLHRSGRRCCVCCAPTSPSGPDAAVMRGLRRWGRPSTRR